MGLLNLRFGGSSYHKLLAELNEYYKLAEGHPEDVRVHLRIAEVLMKLGKKGKAIEEYMWAAEGYEENNLSQIAAAIYKQILQIDPGQINVYQRLVDLHLKEGFLGDAIAAYENLAFYYYSKSMKDEALATLNKMVVLDPHNMYVKKKIERFCSERRIDAPPEEGESSAVKWELFDPVTSGRKFDQKVSKKKREEYFDLEAALRDEFLTEEDTPHEITEIADSTDSGAVGFNEIFKELQHHERESAEQDKYLFHYNLGTAYQKVGRYDEAIEEIKKALEDPKRRAECYLRLAVCSREKNRVDEALKYLKKGLRTEDLPEAKMIELKYEQALAYKQKGKKKKALKLFKQVYELHSTFREIEKELEEATCSRSIS
jgi:tetratricopeptide (TPR) repeat protein